MIEVKFKATAEQVAKFNASVRLPKFAGGKSVAGGGASVPQLRITMEQKLPDPVLLSDWPKWALGVRFTRKLQTMLHLSGWKEALADVGVGDTIYRTIGPARSEAYKAWHLKTFNKSCGCSEKRDEMNAQYCYEAKKS